MSERSDDELLDGLKLRDFAVLLLHLVGRNPRSPRNLLGLRRGLLYVRRAERRLAARGLLRFEEKDPVVTDDGRRALRTGAVVVALEQFDPGL